MTCSVDQNYKAAVITLNYTTALIYFRQPLFTFGWGYESKKWFAENEIGVLCMFFPVMAELKRLSLEACPRNSRYADNKTEETYNFSVSIYVK